MLVEVEFAQSQISQRLVIALACALADRQTVVGHSLGGVAAAEIEIAYGVIYLVEVLGIAVIAHHAPQSLDLRLDIVALIHLALAYAGVELHGVVGLCRTSGAAESLVSLPFAAEACQYLPQQVVETHTLVRVAERNQGLQVRHRLGILVGAYIQVGVVERIEAAERLGGQLLWLDARHYHLGLIGPVIRQVCPRLPQLRLRDHVGKPLEILEI